MTRAGYVIYKRCVPGDRRKVEARSHDSGTGGGARDIRLNPLAMFEGVIAKVFRESHTTSQGRRINSAPVYWWEDNERQGPIKVEIWSPTEARSGEMRLSRVHEVVPFDEDHIPSQDLDPFFLLWTDDEGRVWARYATVEQLCEPGWEPRFVDPIRESVAHVPADRNIRGWVDLRTGESEHRDVR